MKCKLYKNINESKLKHDFVICFCGIYSVDNG
ncbi:DUF7695 domain-containing protein [[Clostridium] symbiosum]